MRTVEFKMERQGLVNVVAAVYGNKNFIGTAGTDGHRHSRSDFTQQGICNDNTHGADNDVSIPGIDNGGIR